ncbi:MAG: hypothetical protein E7349_00910 [Clostridiales bacterium]|nr:hypothetical protein [Clostridiales bacterium]
MMKKKIINKLFLCSCLAVLGGFALTNVQAKTAYAATDEPYDYALAYRAYTIENYSSYMTVKDPLGNVITTDNGTFTPMREGDYTIRNGGTILTLRVFAKVPATTYDYEFSFENEYKTGEIISLPTANVSSAVKQKIPYNIYVEYNNQIIDVLTDGEQEEYCFEKAGDYAIIYSYEDIFGYISTSVNYIEVVDAPVIAYIPPKSISLGKTIEVGTVYAYNGAERVEANVEIYTPSSRAVDFSSGSFVANETGTYSYIVTVQIGGQTLMEQYDVPCDIFTTDLFEVAALAKDPVAEMELPEICLRDGNGVFLQASSSGATYTFANVIDLNTISRSTNLLSFFPYVAGDIGYANDLQIILTDVHDKDNSVGIQFKCSPFHDNLTYVSAFNGVRYYAFDNENWVLTGVNGPVKIGDEYFFAGIMRNHYSMQMKNTTGGLEIYSFTMDYPQRQMVLDLTSEGEGRYTLMDFDNPVWCGGSDYVWNGFTTGEVYMTIKFGTLTGESASIIVTEVAGQSVSGVSISDTVAPALILDVDADYKTKMPYGLVGTPYKIPAARANDVVSGEIPVNVEIFLNDSAVAYNGEEFIPMQAGDYTIKYSTEDRKGNVAKETLSFTVYESQPTVAIKTANYNTPITGKYFEVPEILVSGMSGKIAISTEVVYNGQVVVPDAKGKIYIDKVGEIQLNVTVVDWLGQQKQETLIIPVSVDEMRITVEERYGSVPKGRTIVFEDATVYDFNGKGDNVPTQKIFVNGVQLSGNSYKVENTDDVLNVRYEVSCAGKTEEYSYTINVYENLNDIIETDGKYSAGGRFRDEVHFTFEKDGYFELVNAVSHNYLKLNFATPTCAFSHMDIYLTDSANSDISLFIRVTEYDRSKVRIQLNGKGDYYLLSGSLSAGVPFTFFYEADRLVIKEDVTSKVIFNITESVNGDVFQGFTSEAVYVKVLVSGVTKNSTVRLVAVSNESFTTYLLTGRDSVQPVISVPMDKETVQGAYGVAYNVEPTKAYDILQGAYNVRTMVVAPDGSVICAQQVLNETFTFVPNQYGTYTIIYETFDTAFVQKTTKTVFLEIKDETPPSISLNGAMITEALLGDVMTVVGATATDNYDAKETLKILIYDPQYRNTIVSAGDSYRFTYKGTYKVVYLAIDASGNQTRAIYYIEVK